MVWQDVVNTITRHLTGDVCPQCKRAWAPFCECIHCGYSPKIVACPKCADIRNPTIAERKKLMSTPEKLSLFDRCECEVPYVELDMTGKEYSDLIYSNYKIESWWPVEWNHPAYVLATYAANRQIFETIFDKSQLDTESHAYKYSYALMYPESPESIAYFKGFGGIENYFFPKYTDPIFKPKNVPKCPICGSKNLSRITTMQKATKIALFGIYGLGNCGKTWECNNCGSKF